MSFGGSSILAVHVQAIRTTVDLRGTHLYLLQQFVFEPGVFCILILPANDGQLVEGLNNKIHVIQRRAYGLHGEESLRLKILTCLLPAL